MNIKLSYLIRVFDSIPMLVQSQSDTYSNFINSIKSDVTKTIYEYNLRLFMEFCSVHEYENLIGQENKIIPYVMSLREKKLSFNSISTRPNAIYHFYDMNDVFLNKKKIKMFKGEYVKKVVDKAYEYEDIKKMLDVSDLRAKVVIFLMASTGIRIGSIPALRLKHLEKINDIYKLTVYEGSTSEYFTFCSPECAYYIDTYLQYRAKSGESLTEDSYLIREQFDITDFEQIRKGKNMSLDGIASFLYIILRKSGVRSLSHKRDRKEIAIAHGFRKFFTTQCINAKINPEIREMLLGHKIGLASCYYRPTQEDFIQEYMKAVNRLTINEENRLKHKVEILEIEKSQLATLQVDFEKLKKQVMKRKKS